MSVLKVTLNVSNKAITRSNLKILLAKRKGIMFDRLTLLYWGIYSLKCGTMSYVFVIDGAMPYVFVTCCAMSSQYMYYLWCYLVRNV